MTEPRKSRSEPTNRKAQTQESRTAVLTAAADLFSRHGYKGVAVDDVARLSGVRKPNLLYHFSSKELLWKATVDWVFAQIDEHFASVREAPETDPWQMFRSLITAYHAACRRYPAYVLIPMVEGLSPSWRTEWIADQHLRRHVQRFDAMARQLIERELLPPVDPLHLQNLLTGGVHLSLGLAPLWAAALGVDTADEAFLDAYTRTVFSLLEASHPKVS